MQRSWTGQGAEHVAADNPRIIVRGHDGFSATHSPRRRAHLAWPARLRGTAVSSRTRLSIVKLGGSHANGPHLKDWLTAIVAEAGAIAIVPGGGPFADAVRTAQASMGYDDRAAHAMALMAMAQFGCALAESQSSLEVDSVAFRDLARA